MKSNTEDLEVFFEFYKEGESIEEGVEEQLVVLDSFLSLNYFLFEDCKNRIKIEVLVYY